MNLRPSGYEPDELPGCSIPRRLPVPLGSRRHCDRAREVRSFLSRFGGDLLSHVLRRSTIGATALNGRVRDGIGCLARAVTTKPGKKRGLSGMCRDGVGPRPRGSKTAGSGAGPGRCLHPLDAGSRPRPPSARLGPGGAGADGPERSTSGAVRPSFRAGPVRGRPCALARRGGRRLFRSHGAFDTAVRGTALRPLHAVQVGVSAVRERDVGRPATASLQVAERRSRRLHAEALPLPDQIKPVGQLVPVN